MTFTLTGQTAGGDPIITLNAPSLGYNNVPNLTLTTPSGSDQTTPVALGGGNYFWLAGSNNNSYVLWGLWAVGASSTGDNPSHAGEFVTGWQTPGAQMPATGTATYTADGHSSSDSTPGKGVVQGIVLVPTTADSSGSKTAELRGNASLTATFGGAAAGSITGSLTGMTATDNSNATTSWNNVSVTGTIAGGASTFSGTTGVTTTPGNAYSLATGASGLINGAFYGPNADELGAVFSLKDSAGKTAIGTVGASK